MYACSISKSVGFLEIPGRRREDPSCSRPLGKKASPLTVQAKTLKGLRFPGPPISAVCILQERMG